MKATRTVYVFDPNYLTLNRGVSLKTDHVEQFARWMCDNDCHNHDPHMRTIERSTNGGFCIECANSAGWWLTMCPYIEMTRSSEEDR